MGWDGKDFIGVMDGMDGMGWDGMGWMGWMDKVGWMDGWDRMGWVGRESDGTGDRTRDVTIGQRFG